MENNRISTIISICSTILAIIALIVSFYTLEEQRRLSMISNNYAMLGQSYTLLAENPALFELHNITAEKLAQIGVTEMDVLYVMQSIHAAQSYYETENKSKIDHRTFTPYRTNFLRNPKVKTIWQHIMKDKLISDSPLSNAIDAFYQTEQNN